MKQHPYFPLFMSLVGKRIVVIGAGKIASRRIQTLIPFGGEITVISPWLHPSLELLRNQFDWQQREYRQGDLDGAFLAVAAANSREVNHQVYCEAQQKGILISTADCKEECSFYFPAVICQDSMVIAVNGAGTDHRRVRQTAERIREKRHQLLGEETIEKGEPQ